MPARGQAHNIMVTYGVSTVLGGAEQAKGRTKAKFAKLSAGVNRRGGEVNVTIANALKGARNEEAADSYILGATHTYDDGWKAAKGCLDADDGPDGGGEGDINRAISGAKRSVAANGKQAGGGEAQDVVELLSRETGTSIGDADSDVREVVAQSGGSHKFVTKGDEARKEIGGRGVAHDSGGREDVGRNAASGHAPNGEDAGGEGEHGRTHIASGGEK